MVRGGGFMVRRGGFMVPLVSCSITLLLLRNFRVDNYIDLLVPPPVSAKSGYESVLSPPLASDWSYREYSTALASYWPFVQNILLL
jgi:hypothetical protein